jgi:hypothetical protein
MGKFSSKALVKLLYDKGPLNETEIQSHYLIDYNSLWETINFLKELYLIDVNILPSYSVIHLNPRGRKWYERNR